MNRLLVSDVDDTLTGDDVALLCLGDALATAGRALTVAYNSSRPCASVRATMASHAELPVPDYLIGALGTEIEDGRTGWRMTDYEALLQGAWHRDEIDLLARSLGFSPHAAEYQTALKASYDIGGQAEYVRFLQQLAGLGLRAKVIFSNQIKLDVVPEQAGKGSAIRFLLAHLDLPADGVIVAGDSGNDSDMFIEPFRGIIVGNADDDLRALEGDHIYLASGYHAAGVLEGLRHWGALPEEGD